MAMNTKEQGQRRAAQLYNPSLQYTSPATVPVAPVFWKHDPENAAYYSRHPPNITVQEPSAKPGEADQYFAPKNSYKLLCSDYDWLNEPPSKAPAIGIENSTGLLLLPEPPEALKQTKYMARARTALVKLQQQVRELVSGAMSEAATLEANLQPVPIPTADANAATAASARPTLLAHTRPALLTPNTPANPPASTNADAPPKQTPAGPKLNRLVSRRGLPNHELPFNQISDRVTVKLESMFDDCLSDLMEQLWTALQHAGGAHGKVDRLQQAMSKRDAEIEHIAMTRARALEQELANAKAQIDAVTAAAVADKQRTQTLALAHSSQLDQLAHVNNKLHQAAMEREQLVHDMEGIRLAHKVAIDMREQEHQAEIAELNRRLDGASKLVQASHEQQRKKEEELAAAHTRLGEQLSLLELAFARRDLEIKQCNEVKKTVEELASFFADQGQHSVEEWLEKVEDNAPEGALQTGELLHGPYGLAKGLLLAARDGGLPRAIGAVKAALPNELPRYEAPDTPDASNTRAAPRMGRLREEYVPGLMPEGWIRLLTAPLAEQMAPNALCRHIQELYVVKDGADNAAQAAGLPVPSLHTAIYKHYLVQHNSASQAEQEVIKLIQSVRAHAATCSRVNTFSLFMGLQKPGLPAAALNVYLAYRRALKTLSPGAAAPTFVEDEDGATAWVHPTKWRPVLMGPLARHADGPTTKMVVKAVNELKTQPARSLSSFGMTDMDMLLEAVMNGWLSYLASGAPTHLAKVFKEHDHEGNGVFSLFQFKDMLTNTNLSLNFDDARALDMMHYCLELTSQGPHDPTAARGAISTAAYTQACIARGVVGNVAVPASTLDISRLGGVVNMLTDVQAAIRAEIAAIAHHSSLSDRLQTEITTLSNRIKCAQMGTSDAPATGLATVASPVPMDSDMVASCWSELTVIGQTLMQVQEEASRVAGEKRRTAKDLADAREAQVRQQLEAAHQTIKFLEDEKQYALEQQHKAEAAASVAQAALADARSRSALKARPGSGTGGSDDGGEGGSQGGSRPGSPPSRFGKGMRVSAGGGEGVWPDTHDSDHKLRSELKVAQKRADDAEGRFVALRAAMAEQATVMEKLQEKLQKKKEKEDKAAVTKLLASLQKMLSQIKPNSGSGPAPHLARLIELFGFLHGMASELEATATRAMATEALRKERAAQRRMTSPNSDVAFEAEDGAGTDAATTAITTGSEDEPPAVGNDKVSGQGDAMWPSVFSVTPNRKTLPSVDVTAAEGGNGSGGGSNTDSAPGVEQVGEVLKRSGPSASPTLRTELAHVLERAGADVKDITRRNYLIGAALGLNTTPKDARKLSFRASNEEPGGEDGAARGEEAYAGSCDDDLYEFEAQFSHWMDCALVSVLEVVHLASSIHNDTSEWMTAKEFEVAALQAQVADLTVAASQQARAAAENSATALPRTSSAGLTGRSSTLPPLAFGTRLSTGGTGIRAPRYSEGASARPSMAGAAQPIGGPRTSESLGNGGSVYSIAARAAGADGPNRMPSQGGHSSDQGNASAPDRIGSASTLDQFSLGQQQGGEDVAQLLLYGFQMSASDLQCLSKAVIAAVHACGGFPLVAEDGSVMRADDGRVLVSSSQAAELPDLASQADCLRHLYVSSAGLLVAQHLRASRLAALEAQIHNHLATLRNSPAPSNAEDTVEQPGAGAAQQLQVLASALSTVRTLAHQCKEHLSTMTINPTPVITPSPNPTSPAPDTTTTNSTELPQTDVTAALHALSEELSHADLALCEARNMLAGTLPDVAMAFPGSVTTRPGSPSLFSSAAMMPPFEQMMFKLTGQRVGPEVDNNQALALLLDLHPSQLFMGMANNDQTRSRPNSAQHLNGTSPQPPPPPPEPVVPVLRDIPEQPTPPASPRGPNDKDDLEDPSSLPPGDPLILLDPSLLQRSHNSPSRYLTHVQPPHSVLADGALLHGPPEEVNIPGRRYERRPYTARRYMEAVLYEGNQMNPPANRLWLDSRGAFWVPRPLTDADTSVRLSGQTPSNKLGAQTRMAGPWPWWHPALRGVGQAVWHQHMQPETNSMTVSPTQGTSPKRTARPDATFATTTSTAIGTQLPFHTRSQGGATVAIPHHPLTVLPSLGSPQRGTPFERPRVVSAHVQTMNAAVQRGQETALANRMRAMAPSPEFGAWSSEAPAYLLNTLTPAAIASGALANRGPQAGAAQRFASPPGNRMNTLMAAAPQHVFSGIRADAGGRRGLDGVGVSPPRAKATAE